MFNTLTYDTTAPTNFIHLQNDKSERKQENSYLFRDHGIIYIFNPPFLIITVISRLFVNGRQDWIRYSNGLQGLFYWHSFLKFLFVSSLEEQLTIIANSNKMKVGISEFLKLQLKTSNKTGLQPF